MKDLMKELFKWVTAAVFIPFLAVGAIYILGLMLGLFIAGVRLTGGF